MIEQKRKTFEGTLTEAFDHDSYVQFLRELLNNMQIVAPNREVKPWNTFSAGIDHYRHIGNYVGEDKNKVALFSVCLKNDKNLENARSMQRAFVKTLLESSDCAGALVAFYTNGDLDKWRLSLVRMDYEFSKGKLSEKLTPAKRYSYLVGKGEPCHTAQERLYPIFVEDDLDPSLDELEDAFSVEAVTKDFFDKYREKYLELKEFLDSNGEFIAEAESRGFDSEQFAKKLMGQIVFLYFIQKKGWLGVNAFPFKLTEREYKAGFYRSGRKPKELMPFVYKQAQDGNYYRDNKALLSLSTEDETTLSTLVKGDAWGDGPKDFMRQIFEGCKDAGKNFFDDYLEPLFYTGLNQNRGDNAFFPPLHRRVPFLDGGLFEEMEGYDWRNNDFRIPNELFSNADIKGKRDADGILDVFDRYNFTMAEDEPMEREVAIDPEMLGKVFENLLEVSDRKSKGAFYTPREIVHYMCQESLIHYLTTKMSIPEADIRKFILYGEYFRDEDTKKTLPIDNETGQVLYGDDVYFRKHHMEFDKTKDLEIPKSILSFKNNVNRLQEIDGYLGNVKVVDSAVGSGAFPLGMLNEIIKARDTITAYMIIDMNGFQRLSYRSLRNPYRMKRETIKNSIFACDVEASATDITKLRLWLSLVIDNQIMDQENDELGYSTRPRELPNLDCNIICGNSLVDAFEGIELITESSVLGNESNNRQGSIYDISLAELIDELIGLQTLYYDEKDRAEKDNLKRQIQEIYDEIIMEQIKTNPEIVDKYYQSQLLASKPFILWQLYFPKVFRDNGGFDIAIGNPPYIGERKHKDVFYEVQKSSLKKYYLGRMDFFYFFFHLSLNILRDGGVCSLITTNYFTTALGGRTLRKDFKDRSDILELINFNECKVFETALGQHNMITTVQKGHHDQTARTVIVNINRPITTQEVNKILRGGWEASVHTLKQEDLYDGVENYIRLIGTEDSGDPINAILTKVADSATDLLGNVCNPLIGLESSLDDVYVLSKDQIDAITKGSEEELQYVKEFFKGSQIHRYQVEEHSDKYILYLHEKISDIQSLEGIWHYLLQHEKEIRGRKGANLRGAFRRGNWWVLNTPRLDMDFSDEKIVTHYRSKSLRFALSTTPWYASRDVYYIVKQKPNISLKYILALLNSSLYYQWFYHRGKRKGDTLELYAKPLKETPIRELSVEEQKPFVDLVDMIIERKKSNIQTDDLEHQIDMMVYRLYGLSQEEIDLLESMEDKYGKL